MGFEFSPLKGNMSFSVLVIGLVFCLMGFICLPSLNLDNRQFSNPSLIRQEKMAQVLVGKRIKTLHAMGFFPITLEEYANRSRREVLLLEKRTLVLPTLACKVGRPHKEITMKDELHYSPSKKDDNFDGGNYCPQSSSPTIFPCWFQP